MTRLKVHTAHRLSFRFRTRKPPSSTVEAASESNKKSSSLEEQSHAIEPKVKHHCSAITILPRNETTASNTMEEHRCFEREESHEVREESEDPTQDIVDILKCILEEQTLNSSQVYSISGRQLRIDVLEDTDL